jgi:hypothetical protein
MKTQQLPLRFLEDLAKQFKRAVYEQALPPDDIRDGDPLYQAALAVEQDEVLAEEMAEWQTATIADGLPCGSSRDRSR